MRARLILLALVVLALAPGTWLRSPRGHKDYSQSLSVRKLPDAHGRMGQFDLLGAWELDGRNWRFGGYSALLVMPGGRLLLASDRGDSLTMTAPGAGPPAPVFARFGAHGEAEKRLSDLESLTADPQRRRVWAGYEGSNTIERLRPGPDGAPIAEARFAPPAMHGWGGNTGPEAMVRLRDGRFIVLREVSDGWGSSRHRALLFPGDPVDGAKPIEFSALLPGDYDPSDMAELPDGRVLILLRRIDWSLPPGFATALLLADPAEIRAGKDWGGKIIARIAAPAPPENYEGLAIVPHDDGTVGLWIVSDDNTSYFQRSLLLHLAWDPRLEPRGQHLQSGPPKARGAQVAPRAP
ncbi:MAG: esterase-like activity of phytase family protein [Sphingomonadales bacterium]|nr:esterase-like activity of phytase family protein [Sphingomonadales bacterium]